MALLHNAVITNSVTYSQLTTLMSNSSLAPGHYYEITDYRTIWLDLYTNVVLGGSASVAPSKPFPIIVQAQTMSTLHEEAYAVPTSDYPNADRWKLKYDANLPVVYQIFNAITWASVTQTIANNIQSVLTNTYGDTGANGFNPTQTQNYVDTTFATNNSWTVQQAENAVYTGYVNSALSPALPVTFTPTPTYNTKYFWADVTSLGVIYEMTDEFSNTCCYDFKNVRFARYKSQNYTGINAWLNTQYYEISVSSSAVTASLDYFYTFNFNPTSTIGANEDYSNFTQSGNDQYLGFVNNNFIGKAIGQNTDPNSDTLYTQYLNNTVFLMQTGTTAFDNYIGTNNINNTAGYLWSNNKAEAGFVLNRLGAQFQNNTFGESFNTNTINLLAEDNSFGNNCSSNSIDLQCSQNSIGNDFSENTIGQSFYQNVISNNFNTNNVDELCEFNKIGSFSQSNTIGLNFQFNVIGSGFQSNTITPNTSANTFGPNFSNNVVQSPGNMQDNTFGSSCQNNTIGGLFQNNTVGNVFTGNTIGQSCQNNTFGNNTQTLTFGSNVQSNVFENNISAITTPGGGTNGFSNCKFKSGVSGIKVTDTHFSHVEFEIAGSGGLDLTTGSVGATAFYNITSSGNVSVKVTSREDNVRVMSYLGTNGSTQMVALP